MSEKLKKQAANAPETPGCYLWKDDSETLYVGKALNIRTRLKSYLTLSLEHPRLLMMIKQASALEWISTANEKEALLLEANLIKKLKPRYNVQLKDDKRYPYLCVSTAELYPQIYLVRQSRNDDGNLYFGPYTDVGATRNAIALIHKIFPIRKVRQRLPLKKAASPCINYHIKRCLGPCQGTVPQEEYRRIVDEIILFLQGKTDTLETILKQRMERYSKQEEYEKAAIYRDILQNILRLRETQVVQMDVADTDVIALAQRERHGQIIVVEIRSGRMIGRKSFPLTNPLKEEPEELILSFFRDYYLEEDREQDRDRRPAVGSGGLKRVPARKLRLQVKLPDKKLLEEILQNKSGYRVSITVDRSSSLMKLAQRNAELLLNERLIAMRLDNREKALEEVKNMLGLKHLPEVMECYDISHSQGRETTASGVVFVDAVPQRSSYRRYRIKSIEGIDDPGSIRETIARRLQYLLNEGRSLPDVILIDGGSTQLNAACQAMEALNVKNISIAALAKKREELYFPHENRPRKHNPNSAGMRLLREMRNEAHRFALNYHRSRRQKAVLQHLLDQVESIGPLRKRALLKHFSKQEKRIAKITVDELAKVPGIGRVTAKKIAALL